MANGYYHPMVYQQGYMGANVNLLSLFHFILAVVVLIDLILLGFWLFKQIGKK